ncbi:MAG: TerD family protein [Acidaminococcales bacterium]|jgi:hypothetical protein|nr:TerD family protein [Acidaminococcales bacterium]
MTVNFTWHRKPAAAADSASPAETQPAARGNIGLKSINLVKGQSISLQKTAGKTLRKVVMGLGWTPAASGCDIDLDASCVIFGFDKQLIDAVYFCNEQFQDNSIVHSGDNLTGEVDDDDEEDDEEDDYNGSFSLIKTWSIPVIRGQSRAARDFGVFGRPKVKRAKLI